MEKVNNIFLARKNCKFFNQENFLNFGNERHPTMYHKWKVFFTKFKEEYTFTAFLGINNPAIYSFNNLNTISSVTKEIKGKLLFTKHTHYSSPWKMYDIRGILFDDSEHKMLFILKYGDIMQTND